MNQQIFRNKHGDFVFISRQIGKQTYFKTFLFEYYLRSRDDQIEKIFAFFYSDRFEDDEHMLNTSRFLKNYEQVDITDGQVILKILIKNPRRRGFIEVHEILDHAESVNYYVTDTDYKCNFLFNKKS